MDNANLPRWAKVIFWVIAGIIATAIVLVPVYVVALLLIMLTKAAF